MSGDGDALRFRSTDREGLRLASGERDRFLLCGVRDLRRLSGERDTLRSSGDCDTLRRLPGENDFLRPSRERDGLSGERDLRFAGELDGFGFFGGFLSGEPDFLP